MNDSFQNTNHYVRMSLAEGSISGDAYERTRILAKMYKQKTHYSYYIAIDVTTL